MAVFDGVCATLPHEFGRQIRRVGRQTQGLHTGEYTTDRGTRDQAAQETDNAAKEAIDVLEWQKM
jgi:hypothetical protein